MTEIGSTSIDLKRIRKKLKGYDAILNEELAKALKASAFKIEESAKRSILQGTKSGRVYRRRSVTHQASAPGEAPANDTGRLARSIITSIEPGGQVAKITAGSSQVAYAVMLEFGTAKMLPRPFMHPAFKENEDWIRQRVEKAVKAASKRVGAMP